MTRLEKQIKIKEIYDFVKNYESYLIKENIIRKVACASSEIYYLSLQYFLSNNFYLHPDDYLKFEDTSLLYSLGSFNNSVENFDIIINIVYTASLILLRNIKIDFILS